jgi:hypothetical protein
LARVSKDLDVLVCKNCSKLFDEEDFYDMGGGNFLPLCKDCCESLIVNDVGELDFYKFNELLKELDKMFSYDLWQELRKTKKPTFGKYIKLLIRNELEKKKYKDSDPIRDIDDKEVNNELIEKWGITNSDDIDFLEREFHEWETSYEIDSKAMVDSVKQLCLVELDIRKARQKSDVQALDKLLRIKSQILGDANLKPVQETGNAANEQVSIGMLIKKFEQEEPIPEDTAPDWIDEMKVWIVGQLARMEGLQSDVTEDFNKELTKYGIDVDKELDDKLGDI